MMNKVVEEGTAKRAILEGVKSAGKTGTTNAFRDAWFMGYTGNYTGGVWMGNDNYESTKRMTGGSLPAQIWGQIMTFAHQGIELKTLNGAAPSPVPPRPAIVMANVKPGAPVIARPVLLTKNAATILVRIEKAMDDARAALPQVNLSTLDGAGTTAGQPPSSLASAASPGPAVQGN